MARRIIQFAVSDTLTAGLGYFDPILLQSGQDFPSFEMHEGVQRRRGFHEDRENVKRALVGHTPLRSHVPSRGAWLVMTSENTGAAGGCTCHVHISMLWRQSGKILRALFASGDGELDVTTCFKVFVGDS